MNYYHINFPGVTGGEYPIPLQYQSTSIMGWTDSSVLHYTSTNNCLSDSSGWQRRLRHHIAASDLVQTAKQKGSFEKEDIMIESKQGGIGLVQYI